MPQLKILKNVVDKMKNLSNYVVCIYEHYVLLFYFYFCGDQGLMTNNKELK